MPWPEHGDQFMFEVDDGGAGYYVVNDMNAFSKNSDRSVTKVAVFQRALPHIVASARDQGYTLSGFLNGTDNGQNRLRAAELADEQVTIRVTHDGTNGFTQPVKVISYTYDADPEGLQEHGFSLEADGDAVIAGSGPLL
jgi:hypothetical protein